MKRTPALQPLSREHLTALLVARDLKAADDLDAAAARFLTFWDEDGKYHFRIEEEVLLPGWAADGELDREGVARLAAEHLTIRSEALRLRAGRLSLTQVRALGELLHDHVRFEERVLFPAAEAALDEESLARLEAAIEAAEVEAERDGRCSGSGLAGEGRRGGS
ncbi:MAG: hemerythrin domain-containing protein [Actinobacteria bacterium]|nr:hemerythrin domain-containing protein [Actinomycetota bacterium]